MRLATIGDTEPLMSNPEVNLRQYSTVEEYHDAMIKRTESDATKHIDAGREPYLIDMDAVEFSMYPFVAVHDMMIKRNDEGQIGLDTGHKTYYVGRNTLLAWRN